MRKTLSRAAVVGALLLSTLGLVTSPPAHAGAGEGTLTGFGGGTMSPGEDVNPTQQTITIHANFYGMSLVTNTGAPVGGTAFGIGNCTFTGTTTAVAGQQATVYADAGKLTGGCDPSETPGPPSPVGSEHVFDCVLVWNRVLTQDAITVGCSRYILGPLGEGTMQATGAGVFEWIPDAISALSQKVTGFTIIGPSQHVGT
jgi:hypothetical protein